MYVGRCLFLPDRRDPEAEFVVAVWHPVFADRQGAPRVDAPESVLRLVDAESDGGICKFVTETENKTKKIALLII